MTSREQKICKAILTVLHDLDGAQLGEIALHGEVNLHVECSATEFSGCLALCDQNRWITGVKPRFGNHFKWNINDAGEAVRR